MPLQLNLAMTPLEIDSATLLPANFAWMACHFCEQTEGIANTPEKLPEGAMLILTDREPCSGHSPGLVAQQLADAAARLHCESVLLDFQRPWNAEADAMVKAIVGALPCSVAVTEAFATDISCPVFLSPCPLHMPLATYLKPWDSREIWLEAALCQEKITIDQDGTTITPIYPTESLSGGFFDERLCCHYVTNIQDNAITFTLFDTPEALEKKLEMAHSLGVTRAVGLYQELGTFLLGRYISDCSIV